MVRPILQSTVRLITGSGFRRSSEFVPYLLFGLVLGALVDRVDRKRALTALIAVLFAFLR
jgi:F0F1-type ATP synthase assembly protein I